MTLPDDEFDDFDSVTEAPVSYMVGRNTVVTQDGGQDIIRSARTNRDGIPVVSESFAPVANRRTPGRDVLGRESGHVVAPEDRKPIVTDWSGMDDWANCPPDYGTFYAQYASYVMFLVRKFAHPREVEDMASDIITRFIERDSMGEFKREWETRSASGKSVFRSYLSRFVVTYARGKNRNNVRHAIRYLTIANAPVGNDGSGETTWLDLRDQEVGGIGQPQTEVEFVDFLDSLRARVGPDVVEAVQSLVEDHKRVTLSGLRTALAERTGGPVSARAARSALDRLQAAATALS
jgi:hypothetical protein